METTASRKRMADVAASRFAKDDKKEEELPPVTTIEINQESPNGKQWTGKFTFHVPTLGDMIDISRARAEYLGQLEHVDIDGTSIAEMLAFLHITIEHKDDNPSWWRDTRRGIDLYDLTPILSLYTAAKAYQTSYMGMTAPSGVGAMKKSPERESDEVDSGAMGGDVPVAPERRTIIETHRKGSARSGDDGSGS
jgi:hypothetical protein